MGQAIAWAAFVVIGWAVFFYLMLTTPGGLDGMWSAVRSLPFLVQLAMWALLLPWMIALWIGQTAWPAWIRILLVAGLVWVTLVMSVPPLFQTLRGPR